MFAIIDGAWRKGIPPWFDEGAWVAIPLLSFYDVIHYGPKRGGCNFGLSYREKMDGAG